MQLHENVSRWRLVCNLDRLHLPYGTAGDAGNLHLKGLFLQKCCKPADRANAFQAQSHYKKSGNQKRDEDREDSIRGGKGGKIKPSSNKQRVRQGKKRPLDHNDPDSSVPPLRPVENAKTVGTNVTVAEPRQSSEPSDRVLEKAKTTVASKMEDPASVEFEDMNRAVRNDTFGQSIDTICGHVRGKNTSGGETGKRAFLYLVKEDIAFVDYGYPNSRAANAYRSVCTAGGPKAGIGR